MPKLSQVILKIIPEPATAVNSLRTGHVDLIPRLEAEYLHQVEDAPDLKIIDSPMNLIQLLIINNAVPPFDDIRVRKAINYAVDREEIIEGAAWGMGSAVGSIISPAMDFWYKDLTGTYPHDPEQARALLAEAGYPMVSVQTCIFRLLPCIAVPEKAAQLSRVGIDLISRLWSGTWLEQIYTNREFELTVVGLTGRLDLIPCLTGTRAVPATSNFSVGI